MPVLGTKSCELCSLPAAWVDSVPDATVKGYSPSECGYREQPLCIAHYLNRRRENTARLAPLVSTVICDNCGEKWTDSYPNGADDVIWCGKCQR